jgi:hypothetical protein
MRANLTASLAAAAIGLGTVLAASAAAAQDATPRPQVAQSYDYGGHYYDGYRPACPERYYFACWFDDYGLRHCGCRPGLGYYLFRYY